MIVTINLKYLLYGILVGYYLWATISAWDKGNRIQSLFFGWVVVTVWIVGVFVGPLVRPFVDFFKRF